MFASLAIWLTIERMMQTGKQIDEITKNNTFNNFFKHREEFKKEFSLNHFFIDVSELTGRDIDRDIRILYNLFYYQSPSIFKPHLNIDSKNKINKFLKMINTSELDKEGYNIEDYDSQELKKISNENFEQISKITTSINSNLAEQFKKAPKKHNGNIKIELMRFGKLNELYLSGMLYQSLFQFDGSTERVLENFEKNFKDFRGKFDYDDVRRSTKKMQITSKST